MNTLTTIGIICIKNDYNFVYKVATVKFEELENGNYKYSFYPFYNVIDLLPGTIFKAYPG